MCQLRRHTFASMMVAADPPESSLFRHDNLSWLLSLHPGQRASDADTAALTYAPAPANAGPVGGSVTGGPASEFTSGVEGDGNAVAGLEGAPSSVEEGRKVGPSAVAELLARVTVVLEFVHKEVRRRAIWWDVWVTSALLLVCIFVSGVVSMAAFMRCHVQGLARVEARDGRGGM